MYREPLNPKEQAMYDYIAGSIRKNNYPPSVRDIKAALGIKSTSTVHTYINRLAEKGYIEKEGGKSRTLRTSEPEQKPSASVKLPVIGKIAAGQPVLATEIYDDTDTVEISVGSKYPADELFALRVRGESMINAGILDGDVIIVHRTPKADNGDIVVAMVNDPVCEEGATVKRFYREDGRFRLQPENDSMEPIYAGEVAILGKVIASVRYY